MSERELIKITYDEDSGWTITYPQTGKWVENVDLTKINDAIHIVDFVDLNWTSDDNNITWAAYSLDGEENNTGILSIQSNTPLLITDLTNIDLTGLTNAQGFSCGTVNYVAFRFFNYTKGYSYGERKGKKKNGWD